MTNEHHYRTQHIRISLSTIFHLKPTVLIFWTKCGQKEYYHQIQNIQVILSTKIYLEQTILIILEQIFLKRVFSVQNRKIKNYHRIKHIWISLDAKLHLKQIILIFFGQICPKSAELISFIESSLHIPKFLSCHEIRWLKEVLFKKLSYPFYSLNMIFENSTKVKS